MVKEIKNRFLNICLSLIDKYCIIINEVDKNVTYNNNSRTDSSRRNSLVD